MYMRHFNSSLSNFVHHVYMRIFFDPFSVKTFAEYPASESNLLQQSNTLVSKLIRHLTKMALHEKS